MKTTPIKLSLILAFALSTLLAFSNTSPTGAAKSNDTERTIRQFIKFPQVLIPVYQQPANNTYKIEVLFTTDETGKVNFVLAKTSDTRLKSEIEKQFLALKLRQVKSDVVNSVVLHFKLV